MGLLDDAIKEHLELKRKRGADAEEVARLEQEALGPPQRGEFAAAKAPADADAEPDEPARYGGEEMAVALPATGLQGAYDFAERVRRRIEGLQIDLLDGDGTLRVTASFGAASLPDSAKLDKDALVAAADAALYRAKRSGKNRTVKAG